MSSGLGLFLIIFFAICGMIVLISKFKWHPFIVLLLSALFVGLTSGMGINDLIAKITSGFGSILGNIGIVIIAGTIIGTILERTGAALTMANFILKLVGKDKAALTMSHSYFWVVAQFSDLDTATAYKCQTGVTLVQGIVSLVVILILAFFLI